MTQTQVIGFLVEKLGITKKEEKLTLDELNALIVRELKKEVQFALRAWVFSANVS
jgi:nucleoid DNA-binding protein